ncbi:MAG: POTRA domain-containing protein [Synergistaceae bacterium]|nr:POTRA domain-containing protein [Synergistaceae bacterium]
MKKLINLKKISILVILTLLCQMLCSASALAEEPFFPMAPLDADPLQQLNRMKDLMQKEQLEERLQKDLKDYNKKAVDDDDVEKARKSKGSDLKFNVKDVQYSESTVLKKVELDKISALYIGKQVTLDQLYRLVDEVNELYRKKGYAVCRAFLPEQTIKDGVVKVTLIEGKTGKIKLDKTRYTRRDYVISMTGLKIGKVGNLKELNRRISLYNATNDSQLAVKLAAGEEQGTTDYILSLEEPVRHSIYIFGDTSGSSSTGVVRYGIGWTLNSLLGLSDALSLNFVKSDFSDSGSVSYTLPITKVGTKFSASVSGNGMNIDQGYYALNEMRPRGDSVSYSLSLTQPLCITPSTRIMTDLSWSKQYSDSWYRNPASAEGKLWMSNITDKYSFGVAFTHFGKGVVWYHRHSITRSDFRKGIDDMDSVSWIYNLSFLRQQMFMNGNSLVVKANAQLTPHDVDQTRRWDLGMSTSDYFYIGGIGSVRGYAESQLGSEEGFNVSVEYSTPFRKYRNLVPIFFVDYGKVFGAYAKYLKDTQLLSAGLGLRWTNDNGRWTGTIWLGVPILRDANGDKVNLAKIHVSFSAQVEDVFAFLFKDKQNKQKQVD